MFRKVFYALTLSFLLCVNAFAAADGYGATGLTGGTSGKLDAIDVTLDAVDNADVATVYTNGVVYFYYFNASSGAAESSPDTIKPDLDSGVAYSGDGRWILQGVYAATFQSASGTSITEFSTDGTLAGNSDNATPTEKAVKTYVDATVQSSDDLVPPGSVIAFAGDTCPSGYTDADGSAVSRTVTYDDLFSAVGTRYGVGDGSTTFNLPNYHGYFLRGNDDSNSIDPDAASRTDSGDGTTGDNVGTKQADAFEAHVHSGGFSQYQTSSAGSGFPAYPGNTTNVGSTGGNETRPVNIAVLYCIKY